MSDIRPGDICIVQNLKHRPELNGEEVLVLDMRFINPIGRATGEPCGEEWHYIVEWSDGDVTAQARHELRKKPDSDDQSVEQMWNELIRQLTEGIPA